MGKDVGKLFCCRGEPEACALVDDGSCALEANTLIHFAYHAQKLQRLVDYDNDNRLRSLCVLQQFNAKVRFES